MASNSPRRSAALTFVVLIAAAGAWGWYAWRFSTATAPAKSETTVAESIVAATPTDDAAPDDSAGQSSPPQMTTLRATRPEPKPAAPTKQPPAEAQPFDAREGLAASIRPNAPPEDRQEIEMTLKQRAPQTAASMAKFDAAREAQSRGDLIAARNAFCEAVRLGLGAAEEQTARSELERMAQALVFSRATNVIDPLTGVHIIAPGDTINAVAKKNAITEELLLKTNQIAEAHRLSVGQRIKFIRGPFHARISKTAHRMDIYLKDIFVRSFNVGLGTNGTTPTGSWLVENKLINPDWTDPTNGRYYLADDPDNPIGERWIGLKGLSGEASGRSGFGIHGTIDPSSIGQNMSMGCVRLAPDDVIAAYDLLVGNLSQVVIEQ